MSEFDLAPIALIISLISAFFVILKEGIGLSLGFRESESSSAKRKNINEAINTEYEKAIKKITLDIDKKKKVDDESLELITDIARINYYKDYGTRLLKLITLYGKRLVNHVIVTASLAIITVIYYFLYRGLVSDTNYYAFLFTFSVAVIYFIYRTYNTIKNYYFIREQFLELSETPTSDMCEDIDDSLEEKEINIEL